MAEEEPGFTFVDKRRIQPEAPPEIAAEAPVQIVMEEPPSAVSEHSEITDSALLEPEESFGNEPSPTTYDLIGYCLNLMASQAWQKLGLLADPQTGEARPDMAEAKAAIDVVGDLAARLEVAPDALVPADMRRELRTLLNDLRLNYVARQSDAAGQAG